MCLSPLLHFTTAVNTSVEEISLWDSVFKSLGYIYLKVELVDHVMLTPGPLSKI